MQKGVVARGADKRERLITDVFATVGFPLPNGPGESTCRSQARGEHGHRTKNTQNILQLHVDSLLLRLDSIKNVHRTRHRKSPSPMASVDRADDQASERSRPAFDRR